MFRQRSFCLLLVALLSRNGDALSHTPEKDAGGSSKARAAELVLRLPNDNRETSPTLHDPDRYIPFAIANHFTESRALTAADLDIALNVRLPGGDHWLLDRSGPLLLHVDSNGRVLDRPLELPAPAGAGAVRFKTSPYTEEGSAVRVMNAVGNHARKHGCRNMPVFSPWDVMLDDGNEQTFVASRQPEAAKAGLKPASSEIFRIEEMQRQGFVVIPWTINDKPRMLELMRLGVNGLISDRPDLLREAVEEFDASQDRVGDPILDQHGLIRPDRFDAQGHRGARNLRPENTLPAMEAALDALISTLETDCGVTADGVPVLSHDPVLTADRCRSSDGAPLVVGVLIKDIALARLQSELVADVLLPDRNEQSADLTLSPVASAFAAEHKLPDAYVVPSLDQLFAFVRFYADYYQTGKGRDAPDAARRWRNAERVRFNIETKINPRTEFAGRTVDASTFARAVADTIVKHNLEQRADIQSFDFRTLLLVQEQYPAIRTVYLFGDFPVLQDSSHPQSGDGTNLQPDAISNNTPWLAGMFWPYRDTASSQPLLEPNDVVFRRMSSFDDSESIVIELSIKREGREQELTYEYDVSGKKFHILTD